ncbi:MAG: hypothetical protein CMJ75_14940 [Planctomycetaceae bacterium]|nr:hypothetical protein [Planctomycetaceae bacterium]
MDTDIGDPQVSRALQGGPRYLGVVETPRRLETRSLTEDVANGIAFPGVHLEFPGGRFHRFQITWYRGPNHTMGKHSARACKLVHAVARGGNLAVVQ